MSRLWRVSLLSLSILLALTPGVFAQSQATTGVIEGTVTGAEGEPLPGVTVTLRNTATNYEQVATTDEDGRFRAVLLPLGPYRITATLEGFATLVRTGIDLAVGQTINLRLPMQLAGLEQEITVTAEAPLVETTRSEGATRIDTQAVEGLPNNGRNFLDYTKLTPGVTIVQGPDGDELSINGQKGIANNISVDGADFNNPFFGEQRGGQRPPFTFNLDAVQEVVVVADGAPAEFGRSAGGFVNVVTKSGTNQISGTVHGFFKNDSLSSDPQRPGGGRIPKGDSSQTQFGFTLGGPLVRDSLFYFLAADAQRGDETKQTQAGRMDARLVNFLNSIGIPQDDGPVERTNDAEVALAKLDWTVSNSNLFTLRYSYTNSEQLNGTFDVDSYGRSSNGVEQDYSHAGTLTWISTLSSSNLNELRAQYAKEWRPRPYEGPDIPGQDRPFPDTSILSVDNRFGMPFFLPVEYDDDRKQLTDNFSMLRTKHNIKMGFDYNEVASSQTFIGFANGKFFFTSVDGFINYVNNPRYVECSNAAGQFVTGSQSGVCPAGLTVSGPVILYLQQAGVGNLTAEDAGTQTIKQKEPALFVQDEWHPTANLTVQMGLRWEGLDNPDPRTPADEVFFAPFIGQTRNGQEFPSDGNIPDDWEMWQPRLGISWAPDDKSVVRMTAGVFHARLPALNLASTRSTNGSIGQTLFRNSFLGSIGVLPPPPDYRTLIDARGAPVFFPDVFVYDKDWQTPRTTATSLSWEREVTPGLALLVKGNYAKTDHITRFINRNDARFGSPWSSGLPPGGANGINTLTSVESTAKSRYWGVTVGANKRMTDNYSFQAYYTYSQDKSDDDNERDPFTFRYVDPRHLDREYNWSDRDQRHRFNGLALFRLPWGLDLNARYSYRSAQPRSVANRQPGGTGTFIILRNTERKDNEFNALDLRLSKAIAVGGLHVEPILEVFNVFDEPNFLRPEVTNGVAASFDGTIRSGGGDPRQVQLGLRVVF
ncbi:MAG TPA: carboxypeptidase regulatory-like domain-containing protein [Thermoanaerobaculia bacterium]